jgi:hypothetical protein
MCNFLLYVLPCHGYPRRQTQENQLYYYVVEAARRNGRPRIVRQTYLGNTEQDGALLKDRPAPLPISASHRELGLPGALWGAA